MTLRPVLAAALLVTVGLAGCAQEPGGHGDPITAQPCPDHGLPEEHQDLADASTLHAYWNTSEGDVVVELHHERAPVTVANFVDYAARGFFDETIFHRVIPGFVIQGGGFGPNLTERETREPIPLERHPDLENERGTLSMARSQRPDSATSQFFVNLVDNRDTLGQGAGYAVFGEVVRGMDAVDAIANVSTHEVDGREDVPAEDVLIRCASLDLPDDETDPGVRVAPVHGTVHPAPDAEATVAFQVVNDWDASREVQVAPDADATDVEVPLAGGNTTFALPPGGSALAVATVPAGSNGTAAVTAEEGGGTTDRAETAVRPAEGTGPAVDRTNNTRVDVRYAGLLQTGIPFDSNDATLAERPGLRILPDQGGPAPALQVWTGDGEDPDGEYIQVIPGFRDALLGLRQGQTHLAEVPPDQAYQDDVTRWFHVGVEDVQAT